jgi:hypothetical protein
MANFEAITRLHDGKDAAQTSVMVAFAVMLRVLESAVRAEGEYELGLGQGCDDPSRTPEQGLDDLRNQLGASCLDILLETPRCAAERGLMQLAFMLRTMCELTDHSDRGHFLDRLRMRSDLFVLLSSEPRAGDVLRLEEQFFDLLEDLSVLPDFGGPTFVLDDDGAPELALA